MSDYGYCRCINVKEVKGALCIMYRGRMTRPNESPVDLLKSTSGADMEWLTELFNIMFRTVRCLKLRDRV